MFIKELKDYFEDRNVTDIYIGQLPTFVTDNPIQKGIILVDLGGSQDTYLDTLYGEIDVWAVSASTTEAYGLIQDVYSVVERNSNYDLANYYVYFSHVTFLPADMDRTADGLKLFKMTVRFIYCDKNIIS